MELFREGGVREGNRGGLGLFKWEDAQKDIGKECYLGNTVRASQGRWQNHKNIHWFAIKKEEVDNQVGFDEIADIKRREAEAMAEALGGAALEPDEQIQEDMKNEIKKKLVESTKVEKVIGIGLKGHKKRDYERELRREIKQKDYSPKKSSKVYEKERYNDRGSKSRRHEKESRKYADRSSDPKASKSQRDDRDRYARSRSPKASSSRREERDLYDRDLSPKASSSRREERDLYDRDLSPKASPSQRDDKDSGSRRHREDRKSSSKQTESRYKEDRSYRDDHN
jgi:hypothetical protein